MESTPNNAFSQMGAENSTWEWTGDQRSLPEKVFMQPNPPGLELAEKNATTNIKK